jgi:hypothetical protein
MVNSENSTTNGRLMRYLLDLQGYRFSLYYRRGTENCDADAVSRLLRVYDDINISTEDDLDDHNGVVTPQLLQRARKLDERNKAILQEAEKLVNATESRRLQGISKLNDHIISEGVESLETESGRQKFFENLKKLDINCDDDTLNATLEEMKLISEANPEIIANVAMGNNQQGGMNIITNIITKLNHQEENIDDIEDEESDEQNLIMTEDKEFYTSVYQDIALQILMKKEDISSGDIDELDYIRIDSDKMFPFALTNLSLDYIEEPKDEQKKSNMRLDDKDYESLVQLRREILDRVNKHEDEYKLAQQEWTRILTMPTKVRTTVNNKNRQHREKISSQHRYNENIQRDSTNIGNENDESVDGYQIMDQRTTDEEDTVSNEIIAPRDREIYPPSYRREGRAQDQNLDKVIDDYNERLRIEGEEYQEENDERRGRRYYSLRPRSRISYLEEPKTQPNWKVVGSEVSPAHDTMNQTLNLLFPKSGKDRVEVRMSLLESAGWGLFAVRKFKEGESLCTYEGDQITDLTSIDYIRRNKDYVQWVIKNAKTKERIYVDAILDTCCFGRYANDPIDDHLVNAKIIWNGKKMVLRATTNIEVGDEIYLSYSDDYWAGRLHYLPDRLRSRIEERFKSSNDELGEMTRARVIFDNTVETSIIHEDQYEATPSTKPDTLQRIPQNLLTRIKKYQLHTDSITHLEETREDRVREELVFENVQECEELANEVAPILNGRKFRDGPHNRLYEIQGIRYDEEFETIIGWRKPLSGRTHAEDGSAYCVFGRDGLYELSEQYLIQNPEDGEEELWPINNDAWAIEQTADKYLVGIINQIRLHGGEESVRFDKSTNEKTKYRLGKTENGNIDLLLRITVDKRNWKERCQTMVPKHLVHIVMKHYHEGWTHLGINRMIETIKLRYFWRGMEKDVKDHIDKCINCKLRKTYQRKPQVPIMKYNAVHRPLDRVHIDLVGPLPPTQNGNRYIFVIKDYLTKYVWLIPLRTKTATEVAENYVTRFICQAGIPGVVISDRGNEFVNSLMKNVSEIMGINRISTTPMHPSSNGFVENHNKTLKDQLFNYIDTLKQNDWDLFLPTVQLFYNTTVSLTTGYTPMLLMTGRECNMPSLNHMEETIRNLQPEMINNEYVRGLVETIRNYQESASDQTEKNKLRFNVRVKQPLEFVEYEVGQKFMMVRRPITEFKSADEEESYKISMKLTERYEGPYVITQKISPILYEANIEGKIKRVTAIHMKPY